jgi:hypothetical protein
VKKQTILLGLAMIAGALLSGCITTATTPTYALSGDLVQVGLGGIKRNSTGPSVNGGADLTATLVDASSTVHNVQVLNTFRAYPDHTSWYARDALDRQDGFFGNVEPYDGMWWVTLKLIDPTTGFPLPLAKGLATLTISSPRLIDKTWSFEGSLTSWTLEILEDASVRTRSPTTEEEYQYAAYRHQRALHIEPDNLTGVTEIGGLQVKLTYNTAAVETGIPLIFPRFVPISHDPNINIIQHTVDNGDGTKSLTAIVTNPEGFVPNSDLGGSWAIGKSTFADLQFAVVVRDAASLSTWDSNYWLESAESYFIDTNGDVIASVNPVLGLTF